MARWHFRLGELLADLKRRRVFRAAAFYAAAAWVVVEVAETTLPYLLFPDWTITLVIVLAIAGLPVTLILAWAFDLTEAGLERTASSGTGEETTEGESRRRPGVRLLPASFASLAIVVVGVGLFFLFLHPASGESFEKRDWILIPEFANETGDEAFDGTLAAALRTGMQQSSFVNVIDPRRVADALRRMGEETEGDLPPERALELGRRLRAKAVLLGRIGPDARGYVISARIIDPVSGKPLRRTISVQAAQQRAVLVALDVLAERIRWTLGEAEEEIAASAVEIPMATTSSLQALKSYVQGNEAWEEGRYAEAGKLYQLAIEEDSAFAMAHAALGYYYYYHEEYRPRGDDHLEAALRLRHRLTERERLLIEANVYAARGNHGQAVTARRVYLRKYPDDADQWYSLGTDLMWLQRHDEAAAALERSLEIDPQNVNAYVNIATSHAMRGDFTAALDPYRKAFELEPELKTDLRLNREFGVVLMATGDLEGARDHFELMLELDAARKGRGHRSLGLLDLYQGKYEDAARHFREAVQYYQIEGAGLSEYRTRLLLARLHRERGDSAALRRELDWAWDYMSEYYVSPFWQALAGQLYMQEGQRVRGRRLLEVVRERVNPGNRSDAASQHLLEGELALAAGDPDGAIEPLSLAAKLREDAVFLEPLARAQRLAGDVDGAVSTYLRIVEKPVVAWEGQERWLHTHYWLGRLHEERGALEEAARWYRALLNRWSGGDEDLPVRRDIESRLARVG